MTIAIAVVAIATGLTIVELVARWRHLTPETARKTAHVVAGLLTAVLPLIMSLHAIAIVATIFMPLMLISRKLRLLRCIHEAERTTLGELYFPLGVLCAALAVPAAIDFCFGILVLTLADAAAGIVGTRVGRHGYRFPAAFKTLEGTLTFYVVTLAISVAVLTIGGAPWVPVVAVGVAAALTLTETLFGWGIDNAMLPVVGAVLMRLILR